MKKFFILAFAVVVAVSCSNKKSESGQEEKVDSLSMNNEVADGAVNYSVEEIAEGWQTKVVKVPNGGAKPNIKTLINALNHTDAWCSLLFDEVPTPEKGKLVVKEYNEDSGGAWIVDLENGYACVNPGDSDEDRLYAGLWTRKNGHRLFALWIYTPEADNRSKAKSQALCFYDYDPKTETMTPEPNNPILKFKAKRGSYASYVLPKFGTDFIICEKDKNSDITWHAYVWNGTTFKEDNVYSESQLDENVKGTWMNSGDVPFTFTISEDEGALSECSIYGSTEFDASAETYEGTLTIEDNSEQPKKSPSVRANMHLTRDGRLVGSYYLRQNGGKELRGKLNMKRQAAESYRSGGLNDYAE